MGNKHTWQQQQEIIFFFLCVHPCINAVCLFVLRGFFELFSIRVWLSKPHPCIVAPWIWITIISVLISQVLIYPSTLAASFNTNHIIFRHVEIFPSKFYLFIYLQRKINLTGKLKNLLDLFGIFHLGGHGIFFTIKIKLFNAEMLNLSWYYGSCWG